MSIATQIQNYNDGLLDAYDAVQTKGGTVPAQKNLANLPTAIESIQGGGATLLDKTVTFVSDNQNYQIVSVKNDGVIVDIKKPTQQGLYFSKWQVNGADITFPYAPTNSEETAIAIYRSTQLPDEYQRVEYLGNTISTQNSTYLTIEYFVFTNDTFYTKCSATQSTGYGTVFGQGNYRIELYFNSGYAFETYGGVSILSQTGTVGQNEIREVNYKTNKDMNTYNLFAYDKNYKLLGNIYEHKHFNNDELVEHLIPCYRKSDSVAGMYDVINNIFYTNKGTGSFIVGPDVN